MADRSVSVQMTLSDLERRDARGQIFQRISLMTLVLSDLERPNSACVRSVFLGGSYAPTARAEPQRSPILRFILSMHDTLRCRTTKFDVVTYMGRGLF